MGAALAASSQETANAATADGAVHPYLGGWSGMGGQSGLWLHRFDRRTGKITPIRQISDEIDCGFIHVDEKERLFYGTDETDRGIGSFPMGGGGRVFTYRVDPTDGELTEIGRQNSFGSDPSMVWVDPTGAYVTCSVHTAAGLVCRTERSDDGSYRIVPMSASANLVPFPHNDDGSLADPVDIVTYPLDDIPSFLHSCVWVEHDTRAPECPRQRSLLTGVRVQAEAVPALHAVSLAGQLPQGRLLSPSAPGISRPGAPLLAG